ncbi:DUF4302 domain-containing protein [Chitinophaga sp. MM2321]|uniref:DUF4302 domain-containing protein n=1 Tax=Chitinophaga sp. MM2321 TaxID=3137178 RepID=UPI0032D568AC
MKKTALYILLSALIFTACRKDKMTGNEVEKSFPVPQESLDSFIQIMSAAPDGWEGWLTPQGAQIFHVYFQLDNNQVTLYTDQNEDAASKPSKTSYTLGISGSVNPTLSFGNGSLLQHIVLNSKRGVDTAYAFRYAAGDTVVLLGNRYGDELKLVKASSQTKAAITTGKLSSSIADISTFLQQANFMAIYPGKDSVLVLMSESIRFFGFYIVNSGLSLDKSLTDFAYTLNGIRLRRPLTVAGQAVSEILWDEAKEGLYVQIGSEKVYVMYKRLPVTPLHYLLGNDFPGVISAVTPLYEDLPGWSSTFMNMWIQTHNDLSDNGFLLYTMEFVFLTATNQLNLNMYIAEGNDLYRATYPYKYTKSATGVYTFVPQPTSGNAAYFAPLVTNFTNLVSQNHFTVDYYDDVAGQQLLGKLICVENPAIYCTGFFGSYADPQ